MQSIKQEVKTYVTDNFFMRKGDELSDDASFLDKGLLDSTGVLELVGFLEDRFGIQVADQEMLPENLDSLNAIDAYVRRKGGEA